MPSKTPLTIDQWFQKLLGTLPGWFLEQQTASTLRAHLYGMAELLRTVEDDLYGHIDETFIERASEEFLEAHAAERLVPDIGYVGEARRRQIQEVGGRLTLTALQGVVDDLLFSGTCEIEEGYNGTYTLVPLDYGDFDSQVVDWPTQTNLFSVIIDPQFVPAFSYTDREAYADHEAYVSSSDSSTATIAETIIRALDTYKAAGVRYRFFER